MTFTQEQLQAIVSDSKAILCLAGAGSGKTRVLVHRIVRLIKLDLCRPDQILCLTFTRKAANEMRERLSAELGNQITSHIWIGTFHAIALKMLKQFGYLIGYDTQPLVFDDVDRTDIIKGIVADTGVKISDKKLNEFLTVFGATGKLPDDSDMKQIFGLYIAKMREWKCLCYNLILYECKRLLQNKEAWQYYHDKFKHVMVDEVQDEDQVQYDLHRLLEPENLFVVGDDYQSIYGWRGSDVSLMFQYQKDFPVEIVKLQQNFRSTIPIVEMGNRIISHNPNQYKKELWSNRDGAAVEYQEFDNDQAEAAGIANYVLGMVQRYSPDDVAVLYRKHSIGPEISAQLSRMGIPHQVVTPHRDYLQSQEVRDLIAHLYGAMNTRDDYHVEKAASTPYLTGEIPRISAFKTAARKTDKPLFNTLETSDLKRFTSMLAGFMLYLGIGNDKKLPEIIEYSFDYFKIRPFFAEKDMKTRLSNMVQFTEYCRAWSEENPVATLRDFLEYLNLRSIQDEIKSNKGVTLCTVHACVGPGTLVETENGIQKIENINNEGTIETPDGIKNYKSFVSNPVGQLLKITTKSGYSVYVTPDHGMMAWNGVEYKRINASDLTIGQFLRLKLGRKEKKGKCVKLHDLTPGDIRERNATVPKYLNAEMAELLGLIVSDGTVARRVVRVIKADEDVIDRFCFLIEKLFSIPIQVKHETNDKKYSFPVPYGELNSTKVCRWLRSIDGILPNKKHVPPIILQSPTKIQAAFLKGIFEDGTVNLRKNGILDHVSLSTAVYEIAETVQYILLTMGIVSTIYGVSPLSKSGKIRGYGAKNNHWRVGIYGEYAKIFGKKIGFISKRKNDQIKRGRCGKKTRYLIPVDKNLFDCKTFFGQNARNRGTISRHAAKIHGGYEKELNYHHERIVSIEKTSGPSYCVHVPDGERFLQNGFDGCNSKGLEWKAVVVAGLGDGEFPTLRGSLEEERRLFYVAVTRAKDRLLLTRAAARYEFGKWIERPESRFIREAL